MAWDEAGRLADMLCKDPASALFAALAGWDYPMSREALLLADLFDLEHLKGSDPKKGKPRPHPGRPTSSKPTVVPRKVSRTKARDALRRARGG